MYYADSVDFTALSACTANGGGGENGTVGLFCGAQTHPSLYIGPNQTFVYPSGGNLPFSRLTLASGALLEIGGNAVLSVDEGLVLAPDARIHFSGDGQFNVDGNLTLESGSNIGINGAATLTANGNFTLATAAAFQVGSSSALHIGGVLILGAGGSSHMTIGDSSTVHVSGAMSLEQGSRLDLGGGTTMTVDGALSVTGDSSILCQGKNTTEQVNGQWVGIGVMIAAGNLTVEAGSRITADGQGYAGGADSRPGVGPGGGGVTYPRGGGGGYGGAGAGGSVSGAIYGSGDLPLDLGSGGGGGSGDYGGHGPGTAGGGAIRLTVAGSLQLDGTITANGGYNGAWNSGTGSGGSILVTADSINGGGFFSARGGEGDPTRGTQGGGGGRIAVHYRQDAGFTGFTTTTAAGGAAYENGNVGTVAFFDTSASHSRLAVYEYFRLSESTEVSYASVIVTDAAQLDIGGGSTVTVDGALSVTDGSTILCQGKNTTGQVNGQWVGAGVAIGAQSVTIDAISKITADGQGYAGGADSRPGVGPGGGGVTYPRGGGGGYGGAGAGGAVGGAIYGSGVLPIDIGSGGGGGSGYYGGHGPGSAGGGAIRLTVAGSLQLDGIITANGGYNGAWNSGTGSGGSILVTADSINGSGFFSARGGEGDPTRATQGGGGGRITIYYWNQLSLPLANVSCDGGIATQNGSAGTVVTRYRQTLIEWADSSGSAFHGSVFLSWKSAVPLHSTADLIAYHLDGRAYTLAGHAAVNGQLTWDTTTAPDGVYEIQIRILDSASTLVIERRRSVFVNNAAVWHAGRLAADETWAAGTVHIVSNTLTVPSGIRLTIAPGAIVKFVTDAGIIVESGGILDAPATGELPIVMTSFGDDTVGGDSNLDGRPVVATGLELALVRHRQRHSSTSN